MITTRPSETPPLRGGRSRAAQFAGLLQDFYEELLERGIPDGLAALVRQIPDGEVAGDRESGPVALVVEPDPELRALAGALLEETELTVIECTTAEAALAILQRKGDRIAFVFADETLAGPRDGIDLARSAATLWPQVHMVVTTSAPERETGERLPDGVRALRKPWRGLDVLLAAERAIVASAVPG